MFDREVLVAAVVTVPVAHARLKIQPQQQLTELVAVAAQGQLASQIALIPPCLCGQHELDRQIAGRERSSMRG
ncbi:MAG: hypothetical protein HND48_02045 [Chloroflexi bacterium]|nr:hypothetical protein [Chloroflexota bacterium]